MVQKIAVMLTRKPVGGVPVGGEMLLSRMHARALVAVGLAKYVTAARPPQRRRAPKTKPAAK